MKPILGRPSDIRFTHMLGAEHTVLVRYPHQALPESSRVHVQFKRFKSAIERLNLSGNLHDPVTDENSICFFFEAASYNQARVLISECMRLFLPDPPSSQTKKHKRA